MHTDPLLWLLPAGILLVPLVTFAIILFFGKYIDRFCDKIAIMGMVIAFFLSVTLLALVRHEHPDAAVHPVIKSMSWLNLAGIDLQMGFLVDNLSAFMSVVVTGLASLVLVYS